ncbi:MAG: type II secretion system protein GspJ [Planctomycetota bacterium]
MTSSARAFTLIEVILAIAVLVMVMALSYGVLNANLTAADRVGKLLERVETGPAVVAAVERDLRCVLRDQENAKPTFVGKQGSDGPELDQLDFLSTRDGFDSEKGKVCDYGETGFRLERNSEGPDQGLYTLYRRFDPFVDTEPLKGGTLVPIYTRVNRFNLRYFDGNEWKEDWDNKQTNAYPKLVEVTIELRYADNEDKNTELTTFQIVVPLPQ